MKFVTILILSALSLMAEDKPACKGEQCLTAAERLSIRDPQVKVLNIQTQMQGLGTQYEELKKSMEAASKELSTAVVKVLETHKCKDCGFDAELTALTKPEPKPATPAAAAEHPKKELAQSK